MSDTALIGLGGSQVNCAFYHFKNANGLRVVPASPITNDSMCGECYVRSYVECAIWMQSKGVINSALRAEVAPRDRFSEKLLSRMFN